MSKYFFVIWISIFFLAGCGGAEKTAYVEPDIEKELAKIDSQETLIVPSDATTAVQLMYAMGIDKSMKSVIRIMQPEMVKVAMLANEDFDHEEMVFFQDVMMEELDIIMPELMIKFAGIYAARFSEEELLEILEFQQSDVGIKLNKEQSNLMNDSLPISKYLETELQKRIEKRAGERKASKDE